HTGSAIAKLIKLSPKTALVLRDDTEATIPVGTLVPGDTVIVKPGSTVPADGTVIFGNAALDESSVTGESVPAEKSIGDRVISGSVNKTGYIRFKAERVGENTVFSQIIRLVESASASKAPIARFADRVSGIFVPIVLLAALATLVVRLLSGFDLSHSLAPAITVLVISCPCALGLATPTAITVAVGRGASLGVLIKSARSLETLQRVDTVVFDKTGTITRGIPSVTDVFPFRAIGEREAVSIAASIETSSELPLSMAVISSARELGCPVLEADDFKSETGVGVSAVIGGNKYYLGGPKMLISLSLTPDEVLSRQLADEGKTVLYLAHPQWILCAFALLDVPRKDSGFVVASLIKSGAQCVMLTGDAERTALAVASKIGINRVFAGVLPDEKDKDVSTLQNEGKKVAMVGDGINDAPALVRADVGIAMFQGTDVAVESADIVLTDPSLKGVLIARNLSKKAVRIIKQNLFWALFYNSIGIPLAAGVFEPIFGWQLNPMFGAAAMSLSSLMVVSNALRLRRFNNKESESQMKKTVSVDGMTCRHCAARVGKALSEVDGVASAEVNLKKKTAVVMLSADVSDNALKAAVEAAGYLVTGIK
ncbi:MAG: metal-transporting ATPase, partial [Clostridiales bacterium]|nr:metal-transporting ATPase [Clostridiales bacterium]